MAQLISDEMGCPITQARAIQAANPVLVIDAYLDIAASYPFSEVRRSGDVAALVTREPVGVVGAIVPWNVPLGIASQKLVPALIAGCTVILKPAPQTTLSALALARLVEKAGFPEGVVNVVPADVAASEHLVSHPMVDKISFTGSTAAGRRIASLCGQDVRRVTLELGGKSAADRPRRRRPRCRRRVAQDGRLQEQRADLHVEDPGARQSSSGGGAARTTGRRWSTRCRWGTRATRQPTSAPWSASGSARSSRATSSSGRDQGARVVIGGGRPAEQDTGWFVEPTVFSDVTRDMTIAREEIFGPVVAVMTYDRR